MQGTNGKEAGIRNMISKFGVPMTGALISSVINPPLIISSVCYTKVKYKYKTEPQDTGEVLGIGAGQAEGKGEGKGRGRGEFIKSNTWILQTGEDRL